MPASKNLKITEYLPELRQALPETWRLLNTVHLTVHPRVKSIVLEGSRGIDGKPRPDSDIDLSLLTDLDSTALPREELGKLLEEVLKATQDNSRCTVELDLAAIYDDKSCGLNCYRVKSYEDLHCNKETTGCMGVYKVQKGFSGFVPPIVQISKLYPYLVIWNR